MLIKILNNAITYIYIYIYIYMDRSFDHIYIIKFITFNLDDEMIKQMKKFVLFFVKTNT
jgi:hypothetical protein